jgi:hypothetical protein
MGNTIEDNLALLQRETPLHALAKLPKKHWWQYHQVLGAEAVACFAAAVHGIILIFFEDS